MEFNKELSYKEVCQELNDKEVKGGKSRINQLNRWNKVYEVEKSGRGRYIIKRQLTKQEVQDIQDESNYSKYLQNMLINYFANNPVEQVYTYRELREHLAMVNQHYFPVKYGNENVSISGPFSINLETGKCEIEGSLLSEEKKWFDIAEAHDKDVLKYALNQLSSKGLISSVTKTYVFYKKIMTGVNTFVIEKRTATSEEVSILDQIKLDYVHERGYKDVKALYIMTPEEKEEYSGRVNAYIHSLGYNRYARAFIIVRPADLKRVVNYFAPKFNKMQVKRYLDSKRFKALKPFVHQQLTEKLISTKH